METIKNDNVQHKINIRYMHFNLCYIHFGSEKDYPIRMLVSPTNDFTCDTNLKDIIIENPRKYKEITVCDINNEKFATSNLNFQLKLKKALNKKFIAKKSGLGITILCSIKNDNNVNCWREGGYTHFNLNLLKDAATLECENSGIYILNKVLLSGYKVDEKTTGLIGLKLHLEQKSVILSDINTRKYKITSIEGVKKNNNNEKLYYSVNTINNNSNIYGIEDLTKQKDLTDIVHKTKPKGDFEINFISSKNWNQPFCETTHNNSIFDLIMKEYDALLKNQKQIMCYDHEESRRMICPYAPTDICITEIRNFENKLTIKGSESLENIEKYSSLCHIKFDKILNVLFDDKNSNSYKKIKSTSDSEVSFKYLPFFTFLINPTLRIYKSFWLNCLLFQISKKNMTYGEYNDKFESFHEWRKASEAFQMICSYVHNLEYICDFTKARNGGKDTPIEHFSNCLYLLCGDCEDLSLGIFLLFESFVRYSRKTDNDIFLSNSILSKMRDTLSNNYIPFLCIDGVHLGQLTKEKNDDLIDNKYFESMNRIKNEHRLTKNFGDMMRMWKNETQNMDSAHACVKLIPKYYFEECINRAYESFGMKNVFRDKIGKTRIFYNLYKPDNFVKELPILFGEGTNQLICSDKIEEDSISEKYKYIFFDYCYDICNLLKSDVYLSENRSTFYKSSLIAITNRFINCGVGTFDLSTLFTHYGTIKHSRGISHTQLSLKAEDVSFVPYGINNSNKKSSQTNVNINANNEIFGFTEYNKNALVLIKEIYNKTNRSKKIEDPLKIKDLDIHNYAPTNNYTTEALETHSKVEQITRNINNVTFNNSMKVKSYFDFQINDSYFNVSVMKKINYALENLKKLVPRLSIVVFADIYSRDVKMWRIRVVLDK